MSNISKRVFLRQLHYDITILRVKIQKPPKQAFSSQNAKLLKWYLQNSKSNQVEIWSSTRDHEVLIQKYKIKSQGIAA